MIYDQELIDIILRQLPERVSEKQQERLFDNYRDEFTENFLIFHRVAFHPIDEFDWIYGEDNTPKPRWAAKCHCTHCDSEWLSGWPGGGEIITMYQDMEGYETYMGVPPDEGTENTIFVREGEEVACPWCEAPIKAIHKKSLRNGRLYQRMVCTFGNVEIDGDKLTTLFYWVMAQRMGPEGIKDEYIWPAYAAVLDECGDLNVFTHAKGDGWGRIQPGDKWRKMTINKDPFYVCYRDYTAISFNRMGGIMDDLITDMAGETGEKTGLAAYIQAVGQFPVQYIRTWKRYRTIENAVKSHLARRIVSFIDNEAERYQDRGNNPSGSDEIAAYLDLDYNRPCDMVYMQPAEFRELAAWNWSLDAILLWRTAVADRQTAPGYAAEFNQLLKKYSLENMKELVSRITDGDIYDMAVVDRYLHRQKRKHDISPRDGLRLLLDYHNMLTETRVDVTEAEIWPGNLRAAHDAICAEQRANKDGKYAAKFAATLAKWAKLEWSDGKICAVLPKSNGDLIEEGRKLCHCVGRYGPEHIRGSLIIFIRHARRPERSWYTLNISTTGTAPRRVQLHGYGNEWAHGKKLTIPQRVLDFCERYEREIVAPVFKEVKAAEERKKQEKLKKKPKKGATAA